MILPRTLLRLVLVLGIIWGTLTLVTLKREHDAVRAYPPEGQLIEVDGHELHVVIKGQGPDLVLLHGASGNTRDFTFSLVPKLTDDYRVLVFDRPGFGYSAALGHADGSLRAQADLLQKAAARLGAERPIVLGQSYGAAVALAWAVDHPDHIAGLITVSGVSHGWTPPLPRRYRVLSHPVLGPLAAPLYSALFTEDRVDRVLGVLFQPEEVPKGYRDYVGVPLSLRRSSLITNAHQRAALKEEVRALVPHYPQITIPTAIIHGDQDRIVPIAEQSAKLAREIPKARFITLWGAGHMPHHTRPDAIISAIEDVAQRAGLHHRD